MRRDLKFMITKIYLTTEDNLEMELFEQGLEGEELEVKLQELLGFINECPKIFLADTYIYGETTASYLKCKYDINSAKYELE
jgi:hypothetical protein